MLIYFVVGEPSGDILASRLMKALTKKSPGVRFSGVGGEAMTETGFKSLFPMSELSVMGFWEVAPRLPLILKRMNETADDIAAQRPDVLVTVDSWGFVGRLLGKLEKRCPNLTKVHYVAPQVWAWKKGRAAKVARMTDHLMTLLPYEPPYFEKYGLKCTFVGHPVIENTAHINVCPVEFKARYGIPETAVLLTLLPGSRHSEVSKLAPVFGKVVRQLLPYFPGLYLLIPTVSAMADEVEAAFENTGIPHLLIHGQQERYKAFMASDFALAASGTVSLELTACGTPHVIAYKFNRLTNILIQRLATTRFANLINILAGKFVIPEFVLANCNEKRITPVVLELMRHPEKAKAIATEASQYLQLLKPSDALPSEKAASVVLSAANGGKIAK
ncbi:MAG: lipid-A-disaccharide synthase [Bacteroidales bacterium]|jgi:lipid-A-disaccharide synthase|nr:lipid-A-disaccharide synthase [Bacteroidales bacterium]